MLAAVLLQAIGKVVYGTALTVVPSPVFVFVSFTLTASVFLLFARKGVGEPGLTPLVVLNIATAVTFLSFFFALKLIEPAIAVAVNIGIGPLLAVLIAWRAGGERPSRHRLGVCAGILTGCAVLCVSALRGSGFSPQAGSALPGLAASGVAGVGAVAITVASRALMDRGWRPGAVLAHRFYAVVPASLLLSLGLDPASIQWTSVLWLLVPGVALVGVLVPLYLLQFGIRRCDPYTVMVTMAALPALTFLIEGLSPAYAWSWTTAGGLLVLTASLLADVVHARRKSRRSAA
jgi:drug/metabolite transporter (DMT)-like permease